MATTEQPCHAKLRGVENSGRGKMNAVAKGQRVGVRSTSYGDRNAERKIRLTEHNAAISIAVERLDVS